MKLTEIYAANLKPGHLLVATYAPSGRVSTLAHALRIGTVEHVKNEKGYTVETRATTASGMDVTPFPVGAMAFVMEGVS